MQMQDVVVKDSKGGNCLFDKLFIKEVAGDIEHRPAPDHLAFGHCAIRSRFVRLENITGGAESGIRAPQ